MFHTDIYVLVFFTFKFGHPLYLWIHIIKYSLLSQMRIHEEPTEVKAGETDYNMKSDTWDTKPLLEVIEEQYLSNTDSSVPRFLFERAP